MSTDVCAKLDGTSNSCAKRNNNDVKEDGNHQLISHIGSSVCGFDIAMPLIAAHNGLKHGAHLLVPF